MSSHLVYVGEETPTAEFSSQLLFFLYLLQLFLTPFDIYILVLMSKFSYSFLKIYISMCRV